MAYPLAVSDEYGAAVSTVIATNPASTQTDSSGSVVGNVYQPSDPHPTVVQHRDDVATCRDLMSGTRAIHNAGDFYLPKFVQETPEGYDVRVRLAAVMPAFQRTVTASTGLVMATDPKLGDDNPPEIKSFWESVDGRRRHGAVFAKELLQEGLTTGIAGILSEYPRVANPGGVDRSQQSALGLNAYWVLIRREDIVTWRRQILGGKEVFTLIVFRERVHEDYGPFGVREVTRYRVFKMNDGVVTFELWAPPPGVAGGVLAIQNEDTDQGEIANQTEIPFSPFIAGIERTFFDVTPPLLALAELNIDHHRVNTEHRHLMMLCNVPQLKRIGYKKPIDPLTGEEIDLPVLIGPANVFDVPIGGDILWFSPDSRALDHDQAELGFIEKRMGVAGLSFVAPDVKGRETAQAKRIDATAQNGSLAAAARASQDCLEMALGHAGNYMGVEAGSVTVNRDFERIVADPQMVAALSSAAAAGNLPIQDFLNFLVAGGIVAEGYDTNAAVASLVAGMAGIRAPALASGEVIANVDDLSTGSATAPSV